MLRKADVGDRLGAEVEPSELGRIAELISCSAFKLYIKKQFPLLWGGRQGGLIVRGGMYDRRGNQVCPVR